MEEANPRAKAPAPLYLTAAPKRRRRRRKIFDDDTLVEAVLAVGFEKLTIEAVGAHLDAAHSAIYHHVKNREALVELAMNHLVRRQTWPAAGPDWRGYLYANGSTVWQMLEAHPGLSLELTAQSAPSAALAAHVSSMCSHLTMLGFTPADAFLAVDLVIDLAFDVAIRTHYILSARPGMEDDGTWYFQKLEVVLDGVATRLAPKPSRAQRAPVVGRAVTRS